MDFKEPNILFLRNISKNVSESSIKKIEDINEDLISNIVINKYKQFTNIKNWEMNDDECWQCNSLFNTLPIFYIINMNYTATEIIYDTDGNFCSLECMNKYIKKKFNIFNDFDIFQSVDTVKKLLKL